VVTLLAEAAADGRLTLEEHAGRVQRAYTARTLGELAGLTSDLAVPAAQPVRLDGSPVVTAFFSRERRAGRWVVPSRLLVTAIGGQVVLDLREALLQSRLTIVQAVLLGGQLNLLVPDGLEVIVTGARGAGRGHDGDQRPDPVTAAGGPVIEIRGITMAGQVRVHKPRPQAPRWRGVFPRRDRRLP